MYYVKSTFYYANAVFTMVNLRRYILNTSKPDSILLFGYFFDYSHL